MGSVDAHRLAAFWRALGASRAGPIAAGGQAAAYSPPRRRSQAVHLQSPRGRTRLVFGRPARRANPSPSPTPCCDSSMQTRIPVLLALCAAVAAVGGTRTRPASRAHTRAVSAVQAQVACTLAQAPRRRWLAMSMSRCFLGGKAVAFPASRSSLAQTASAGV